MKKENPKTEGDLPDFKPSKKKRVKNKRINRRWLRKALMKLFRI